MSHQLRNHMSGHMWGLNTLDSVIDWLELLLLVPLLAPHQKKTNLVK